MNRGAEGKDFDFQVWLDELKGALQVAGDGYMRRDPDDDGSEFLEDHWPPIPSNRTAFAWLTVMTAMNSLGKLPGMQDHVGLIPLHDVVAAMIDLGQGGKPRLLQPIRSIGKGKESTQRRWVRQHAIFFVGLLVECHVGATKACKEVAELLAKSGHVGRKQAGSTQGLSWKTVEGWWTASRQRGFSDSDPQMAAFLERSQERLRAERGWPIAVEDMRSLVKEMASNNILVSKA
jgi:hypothetical protein